MKHLDIVAERTSLSSWPWPWQSVSRAFPEGDIQVSYGGW